MSRAFSAWNSSDLSLYKLSEHLQEFNLSLLEYIENTVEHLLLVGFLYITICICLYYCIVRWKCVIFTRDIKNARRILLVTAHPDDEVMFFGPTILHYLTKGKSDIYLLCLSTGQNYGMGSKRKEELYQSCTVLGIPEENVVVRNHTNLPDAQDVRWPVELISDMVIQEVERFNITSIITFDRDGVSQHANHCSIYYAIANLILENKLPNCCGVYVLESINVVRKYWLLLDIPICIIMSRFRIIHSMTDRRIVMKAMKKHKSQLLWFRKLYMCFSRYTLINTLQQMNLVDIELDLEIND